MKKDFPDNVSFMKAEGLSQRIAQLIGCNNKLDTAIPGLTLYRWDEPTNPTSYIYIATKCLFNWSRSKESITR
jgi:hypothetical protein